MLRRIPKPGIYYLLRGRVGAHLRRIRYRMANQSKRLHSLLDKKPSVLLVYEMDCASKRYRVNNAMISLEELGLSCQQISLSELDQISAWDWLDHVQMVLLHRLPSNPSLSRLLKECKKHTTFTVLDLDDAVHNKEIYGQSAVYDHLNRVEKILHDDMANRIAETIRDVDHITVSTDVLKNLVQKATKNVTMVPNRISPEMVKTIEAKCLDSAAPITPTIGYMSGTSTHHRDFSLVTTSLEQILEKYPESKLIIAGPLQLTDSFTEKHQNRIQRLELINWPDFLCYYQLLTVNLAPLEDTAFCRAKSGIKFLEAALSAVPTIASATPDFQRLIQNNKTGFLVEQDTDWFKYLNECLSDEASRKRIGENARNHVLNSEQITSNKPIWQELLTEHGVNK